MGHTFRVGAWAPETPASRGTQALVPGGICLVVGADPPRTQDTAPGVEGKL